ncbi:hypothetical protein F1M91_24855, partial [Escherichia coli]|nr:hypothetical protein [Escherichia coli]EFE8196381.1 hypothetical protein [Escherichia coli]
NRGSLLSAGTLSLDGNSLDNRGTVQGDHVTIRQNSVTNSGTFTGIAALTLAARMVSPQCGAADLRSVLSSCLRYGTGHATVPAGESAGLPWNATASPGYQWC